MNGARMIVDTLIEEGVEVLFGYPGGAVLPIYDALYERRETITHILTCHEQGAAHAADGYARAARRPGVVLATSGPGATNLVTGIAAAYMDSTPLVALTGNVPLALLGRDSFQEVDIAGVTMPITKYNYIVKSPGEIRASVRDAFAIAQSGRPGPVLVDIPRDIAEAPCGAQREKRHSPCVPVPSEREMDAFARALARARRPVLLIGGGVVADGAGVTAAMLAERLGAPVCATLMGLGALPWDHPLFLGMLGRHGLPEANRAVEACDLLLAIGTRFTERAAEDRRQFAGQAQIFHIDIDPAEVNKNIPADAALCGRAGAVMEGLLARLPAPPREPWGAAFTPFARRAFPEPGTPHALIHTLWRLRTPGMTVVTDVGQHQMWTAQTYGFSRPGELITSGGLGAMGFGLGAAVGVALARPGRRVALVTGDASLHMNMAELATAVALALPISVFVLDNAGLGLVRQLQDEQCGGRRFAVTPGLRTDWVRLAEAMGARGLSLAGQSPERVVREALTTEGPCLTHCPVDPACNA
ncbi:MAG: biosynthetic-type acetolactate synthase large subunit [Oscillospiraceae bacterium]|jgi:acetolactate synthase-1/2/3 large subunit|nr:biosynthetic-type acetolactate synthase large subunit [Oscillospiraceae bacterium]